VVFKADYPYVLLLLLLIPPYIYVAYRHTPRLMKNRKRFVLSLRFLMLLLVILLLSGLSPYEMNKQKQVLFLVDRSDSNKQLDEQLRWMNEALVSSEGKSASGVYSFGANVAVDQLLNNVNKESQLNSLRTTIDGSGTNIAGALRQAGAFLASEGGGNIVLISDGRENIDSAQQQIQILNHLNVSIDTLYQHSEPSIDVAISEFLVPSVLKEGEKYKISVDLESVSDINGKLMIYEDQKMILEQQVSLIRGSNSFMHEHIASNPGIHRYRAEIYVEQDEQLENNEAYAISRVSGPSGVLIVEEKKGSSANIEAMLFASHIGYKTILPAQLSLELTSYLQYDSIIFNNVSAVHLSEVKMKYIEAAVKDYGVGFMMLGGQNSYGLGGYFQTPIEQITPVDMELQGKRRLPSLGLVLVIDRSGSMMGDKLELAKEAAVRSIELMREEDYVGIISFDSAPTWTVEPTSVKKREQIVEQVLGIQAEGGTDIYPAIYLAVEEIKKLDAERKHIILLTDGQSGHIGQYDQLAAEMGNKGITLSTVAVGQDADKQLLESLAGKGNGRYYYTEDQTTIPAIFSREAVMMSRTYVVENRFQPIVGHAGAWNRLWNEELPYVDAYVATTAKPLAEIALWSPENDPILARWNIGAGKAVAWTSDISGEWAKEWVMWQPFSTIFVEWLKWTFPQYHNESYTIKASLQGDKTNLVVQANTNVTKTDLALTIHEEGREARIHPLIPIGNGQYEVNVERLATGVYMTQIGSVVSNELDELTIVEGVTSAFIVPYSPEYRLELLEKRGEQTMKLLSQATDGRELSWDNASNVFQIAPIERAEKLDWSKILLLLILILWLIDIAVRRLHIHLFSIEQSVRGMSRKLVQSSKTTEQYTSQRSIDMMQQRIHKKRESIAIHGHEQEALKKSVLPKANHQPSIDSDNKPIFNGATKTSVQKEATQKQKSTNQDTEATADERMKRLLAAKSKHKTK